MTLEYEWIQHNDTEYPATRGEPIADERVQDGLRVWNPYESKLAAVLVKGYEDFVSLDSDTKVLYLGAAAGTTPSYVADICKVVYAVEFATTPASRLIEVAEEKDGLMPVVEDARKPERYTSIVEKV
ncbi:MAG: fibrillarin-like rRNA/tRNA 2'-O-methyltransferase, partial [Halobacteria archaeon]|nr:fibrillarin-like rRNA/tRNA 2'-O-methyltransferase [Halobacteria archaeon]